jgi:hypothetical protein
MVQQKGGTPCNRAAEIKQSRHCTQPGCELATQASCGCFWNGQAVPQAPGDQLPMSTVDGPVAADLHSGIFWVCSAPSSLVAWSVHQVGSRAVGTEVRRGSYFGSCLLLRPGAACCDGLQLMLPAGKLWLCWLQSAVSHSVSEGVHTAAGGQVGGSQCLSLVYRKGCTL